MNGWANYNTWNVSLWIGSDEALYHAAKDLAEDGFGYRAFVSEMEAWGLEETPDGVSWTADDLDIARLDEMMAELVDH
jgi:hypothetical protein